jgi:hypothetical protein
MVWLRQISTRTVEHLRGRSVTEFVLIGGAFAVVVFVGLQTIGR